MKTVVANGLSFIPREEWGAATPRDQIGHPLVGAQPHYIVHHSYRPHLNCGVTLAAEAAAVRSMDRYHAQQGWGGASYAFFAFQSGRIYEGRGWGRTGAHTVGRNSSSVGVCVVVDGDAYELTEAAWEALRLIQEASVRGGHLRADHRVSGHRDHLPRGGKSCPGVKVWLQLQRRLGRSVAGAPVLQKGDGGKAAPAAEREIVQGLQRRLGMPAAQQTGFFGDLTEAAVRALQQRAGLTVDGVVGPATWAAVPINANP